MAKQTAEAIAEWADTQTLPADKPKYRRLTDVDRAFILRLHDKGRTQVEIAQQVGCAQSTVSEVLDAFGDTTPEAKRYLRGQALRMARNIVEEGQAKDHVAALKGLSVLADDVSQGLTIQIGGDGHDIKIALLSPPVAQVTGEGA